MNPAFSPTLGRFEYAHFVAAAGRHTAIHCLSKTKICVNSLPSVLVPLAFVVIVLPPFETTVRLVAL